MGGHEDQEAPVTAMPNAAETEPATPQDLESLWQAHHRKVLQAAYRVTGDAGDAEDVLQTVFLRLLRNREADVGPNPAAYLQRAAVNAALDLVRARRRAPAQSLEPLEPFLAATESEGPEARRRETELADWLRGAIGRLPAQAAEVFALHMFEGLSHPEIAIALGMTPNTVAVVLHRTRRRLREDLRGRSGPM
jgi:RNA polymerase sigma-70 factor (ECF subfamily)